MPSFICKHILLDGTLDVGKNSVIFDGGSDATKVDIIKIPLEDVAELKKVPEKNGIYFITRDGSDYLFINIEKVDDAYEIIENARNLSLSSEFGQEDGDDCHKPKHVRRVSDSNLVVSVTKNTKILYGGDGLDELLDSISDVTYSMKVQRSSEKLSEGEDEQKRRISITKSIRLLSIIGKKKADPQATWNALKKSNDNIVKEVALSNVRIKCSFDTFFKNYWSGSAKTPISKYQESVILDQNINTSSWEEGIGGTLERKIEYLHPNDAPMGPKMADSIKDQVLEKFGKYGMLLTTTTTVKDVPMADCFVLLDKIFVEPDGNGVCINAYIGIKFVKSTMWKKVIEKNAKKGITKWLSGYVDFLAKN